MKIKKLATQAVILLSSAVLIGCKTPQQPKIGQYTITVTLDESLKNSSVIVDLVGVNLSNLGRFEVYDMAKYWKEGDTMRRGADKKVLNFVSGQTLTQSLAITDPQWDSWKAGGVTHVLVMVDLPGSHVSKPGNQDPRRHVLVLGDRFWIKGTKELKVLVQHSGITAVTDMAR